MKKKPPTLQERHEWLVDQVFNPSYGLLQRLKQKDREYEKLKRDMWHLFDEKMDLERKVVDAERAFQTAPTRQKGYKKAREIMGWDYTPSDLDKERLFFEYVALIDGRRLLGPQDPLPENPREAILPDGRLADEDQAALLPRLQKLATLSQEEKTSLALEITARSRKQADRQKEIRKRKTDIVVLREGGEPKTKVDALVYLRKRWRLASEESCATNLKKVIRKKRTAYKATHGGDPGPYRGLDPPSGESLEAALEKRNENV